MLTDLDTGMVANLNVLNEITLCHNDTGTLMSSNQRKLGGEWPVSVHGVKISVADTRELDVDENFIRARLRNRDLLVLDWSAGLLNDLGPLLLWDLRGRHGRGMYENEVESESLKGCCDDTSRMDVLDEGRSSTCELDTTILMALLLQCHPTEGHNKRGDQLGQKVHYPNHLAQYLPLQR